jgi:hypothetical protein
MSVDWGSGGTAAIAFSSEADAGSREENASKQKRLKTKNQSLGSDQSEPIRFSNDAIGPKQVMLRNIVDINRRYKRCRLTADGQGRVRSTGGDIAPEGAKLVHALLMRTIGRFQRVVRKEPLR